MDFYSDCADFIRIYDGFCFYSAVLFFFSNRKSGFSNRKSGLSKCILLEKYDGVK